MYPSDLEDCLEAILNLQVNEEPVSVAAVAAEIDIDEKECNTLIGTLEAEGKVIRNAENRVTLTVSGKKIAESVARKHRTLECFFREMLGMDSESASREACTLEHSVSDEAIERLSSYIEVPCPQYRRGRFWRHHDRGQPFKTLLDFKEGTEVKVALVRGPQWNRRLIDLGIVPGEYVKIRRKLRNHSIVIQVKGCDVALSPEIARTVFVE